MRRVLVAALASLAVAAPAHASPVIVTGPGAYLSTYTTPVVTYRHGQGQTITLVQADVQPHNVLPISAVRPDRSASWCDYYPSGNCPLFWTPLIGLGETALVEGLEDTVPGTLYDFYCDYHPGMTGTLVVV